jgi:hypothetical protein
MSEEPPQEYGALTHARITTPDGVEHRIPLYSAIYGTKEFRVPSYIEVTLPATPSEAASP